MRQQKRLFDQCCNALKRRLKNRRLFLNPFKLDPIKHMQRYALSDREWAALKYLSGNPDVRACIREGYYVCVKPESLKDLPFKSFRVNPKDGNHFTMVNVNVVWGNLPEGARNYIVAWADYDFTLKQSGIAAHTHFEEVGDTVRTWGQLYRLWPSLLPLFPQELRHEILNKKAKSKIPEDILINPRTGTRRECFDPARIEETDMIFAEMMMLPTIDESEFPDPIIGYHVELESGF